MRMGGGAGRFEPNAKARWHAGTLANWHAGKLITRGDPKPGRDIRLDYVRLDTNTPAAMLTALAR